MDESFCLCLFFFPSCVMKSALPLNSFHSDERFIINYCLTTMKVCKMCRLVRFHSATQKESHVKHTQLFSEQTVKSIKEFFFFFKNISFV